MSIVVAITGVSSLLGENLLEILENRQFLVAKLILTDPGKVVGRSVMFAGHANRVISVDDADLTDVDVLFNCHPKGLPKDFSPCHLTGKLKVIDLCPSADLEFPCIVPEINPDEISTSPYLISPSPAAVVSAMALHALHQRYKILRLNLVSLCSVAEAGKKGVEALASETAKLLNGRDPEASYFGQQIAFNLIPFTGTIQSNGRTDSEETVVSQLQHLLGDSELEIAATAVQLPLFHGQQMILHAECQFPVNIEEAHSLVANTIGVISVTEQVYSVVADAVGENDVFISRFRAEEGNNSGIMLVALSDSLRKGGALNAVQIAESLFGLS